MQILEYIFHLFLAISQLLLDIYETTFAVIYISYSQHTCRERIAIDNCLPLYSLLTAKSCV